MSEKPKEALTSEERGVVIPALEWAHDLLVVKLEEITGEEKKIIHEMAVLEDAMDKIQEA